MELKYLFFILFLISPASAFTISPDGPTHVVIEPGTTYNFSYSTVGDVTGTVVYLDGIFSVTPDGKKYREITFAEPGTYHNVTLYSYRYPPIINSNLVTYNVVVQRQISTDTIETFNESDYNSVMENIEDEDWEGVAGDSTKPFVYILGRLFYLILFVLPYGLMWMKQQKLTIPVVLSLFLGSLFIGFVPEQYKQVLIGFIGLSYAVNLYMITRER